MSPENKAYFLAEKEAIHLILTGIGDDIYSTVDACQTAQEIWEAIKRLQQGESLNIQDVKTNLVTIVKQQHKLNEVSYHKLFDILKQYQNEVNELRAEKLARNANPLCDNPSISGVKSDFAGQKIVMDNPNSPNEPNENIPEENLVIPEPNYVEDAHDPNEMVDIHDEEDLVDYDGMMKNRKKNQNNKLGTKISLLNTLTITPPKFQQRSGIPLGVLLHSPCTQVTENDLKKDV
nr:hypothetical protein [Tanacetum cinerariifolium]